MRRSSLDVEDINVNARLPNEKQILKHDQMGKLRGRRHSNMMTALDEYI